MSAVLCPFRPVVRQLSTHHLSVRPVVSRRRRRRLVSVLPFRLFPAVVRHLPVRPCLFCRRCPFFVRPSRRLPIITYMMSQMNVTF